MFPGDGPQKKRRRAPTQKCGLSVFLRFSPSRSLKNTASLHTCIHKPQTAAATQCDVPICPTNLTKFTSNSGLNARTCICRVLLSHVLSTDLSPESTFRRSPFFPRRPSNKTPKNNETIRLSAFRPLQTAMSVHTHQQFISSNGEKTRCFMRLF